MQKTIALLAAGLFSTALMAGDEHKTATFDTLDRNADQQISKTEAQGDKMLSDAFASTDANGDGYLSKSEFNARHSGSGKASSGKTTPSS